VAPQNAGNRAAPGTAEPGGVAASGVPIVVTGASAGGFEAICRFFDAMPPDRDIAFIVIQHLDPTSRSVLPELLGKHTKMPVRAARDGDILMPRHVYVIPPGAYMTVSAGMLGLSSVPAGMGARMPIRMPIDIFLHSLATNSGPRGIGIILSGTGTDGAQGLKALKEAGGLALVQEPQEAQQDGMPRHAILTAHPDEVLPVAHMPATVLRYVGHDYIKAATAAHVPVSQAIVQPELDAILGLLKTKAGQDFSRYKPGTLQRRIERRMALRGAVNMADYLRFISSNPAEVDALAKDLLINVTRFFRDPEAYVALEKQLPALVRGHARDEPVRVWVVGCSTGEEAYSLSMMLFEPIAAMPQPTTLQIFATDVDDEALQTARAGFYPNEIQADVSAERLKRFFVAQDSGFRVTKELRDTVIFSRHDVTSDPPFTRIDLVSCRNLLIYLRPETQHRVLSVIHFALREHGVLFLGSAESVNTVPRQFEPIDEKLRIYRCVASERPARIGVAAVRREVAAGTQGPAAPLEASRTTSLLNSVQRAMLDIYAPAAVVVNRAHVPLYYFGAAGRYLEIVAGEANQDVLSMAREGLRVALRQVIARAFRGKRRVAVHGIWVKRNGKSIKATIEAQPLPDEVEPLVLVSFIDEVAKPGAAARRAPPSKARAGSEVARLRLELIDSRRGLNQSIHDLRRANDDLKAKNEEAMSLNEEFLSTNEELESSKEELQSLNEELTTLNNQLHESLDQSRQASTDLTNLLNSSPVATILLDSKLNIKLFNPKMRLLFSVLDSDIGRPLADLLPKFADPSLMTDVMAAQTEGTPSEREIRAEAGPWYVRSALPYRTEDGTIQGAVVTFADVSELKRAELEAASARHYAEGIVDTIREPLVVIDQEANVVSSNTAFRAMFGVTDQIAGAPLRNVGHPIFSDSRLFDMLAHVSRQHDGIETIDFEVTRPDGAIRVWRADARQLPAPSN
jgi:two-component system, chemotaxis family, CheB/CheR fusion protein